MYEDRPSNLSLKDYLIKTTAKKMEIPENIVEEVVSHQFKTLASKLNDFEKVEISGLGRFLFNVKKAKKVLIGLNKKAEELRDVKNEIRLQPIQSVINDLNKKLCLT